KNFYFAPGVSPGSGLRSVEYRDGSVCRIGKTGRIGGARACPLKGYVAPKLTPVTRAQLATTVRVSVGTKPERPGPAHPKFKIPAQRRITITFRARRPADSRSFYTVETQMLHGRKNCQGGTAGPIAKDVKAGTVLSHTLWVPYQCRNEMKVDVGYAQP